MTETTTGLRDRALAEWQEQEREWAVEESRRQAERQIRVLTEGMARVVGVLDGSSSRDVAEVKNRAAALGVNVVECGESSVIFDVEGITLRWAGHDRGLTLETTCAECGGWIAHNTVHSLAGLGAAIAAAERNPKAGHRCPPRDEEEDEFLLTLSGAMSKCEDPALVLLDAIQGYVHAVVRAAMDAPIPFVLGDEEGGE